MYFVSHKYDAASTFDKFLADLRVEGTPSEVVMIRSDDGGEFIEGKFRKSLSRKTNKTRIYNCGQSGVQWSSRAGVSHDRSHSTSR